MKLMVTEALDYLKIVPQDVSHSLLHTYQSFCDSNDAIVCRN